MAPPGVTAVSGRVLRLDGSPLPGVTVELEDGPSTRTDVTGRYLLRDMPAGHLELVIDGGTASTPTETFGLYEQGVDVVAGKTTTLEWFNWLPALDTAHSVQIPKRTTHDVVVRNPSLPRVEIHVKAGTWITDHNHRPVTELTLTKVPLDRTPVPLPPGMPVWFDLQPGGAYIYGTGVQVVYPNHTNQPPGTHIDFVEYDTENRGVGWEQYGGGTVSKDGTQILPDRDTYLYEIRPFSYIYNPLCEWLGLFCPKPGEDSEDGDPVDLGTGLFTMSRTDLGLPDVTPITVSRTYRQHDKVLRSFGVGQNDEFNYFIAPGQDGAYNLQQPDGGNIIFAPGTDGVYRAKATPTRFFGAILDRRSAVDYTVTLRDGTIYTFGTHTAVLTAIADRFGNTTTLTRHPVNGRIERVTSPNGRWLSFTYGVCHSNNTSVCITRIDDNIGRSVAYTYDDLGRLTSFTDPAGKKTTYTWALCENPNDTVCTQITQVTDPRGIAYLKNSYDANGRVATQTQADGGIYKFAYTLSESGQIVETTVTDPRGAIRKVGFNANGYTISDTAAVGTPVQAPTTLTRDATTNLVTSARDPLGRQTTYTYDANGNVKTATSLAGTPNAGTTTFTYEPKFDRVTSVTDPLGHKDTFAYDDANQKITATDALGRRSVTTLIDGQPVALADSVGNTSYLSYLDGDLVAIADPLGRVSTRYLDAAGRLLRATDPMGNYAQYTYDKLNQISRATDPMGGVTTSTYDANGNQLTLTDANNKTTTFTDDVMDRVATMKDPLGKVATNTYDKLGNLIKLTDRIGKVHNFTYDLLGRQTFAGYAATTSSGSTTYQSTITYTYDLGDRLKKAVDTAGGTITREYDGRDNLLSEAGPTGTVTYAYDLADRRTKMTVLGQADVVYAYNNADQLTQLTRGTTQVTMGYDAIGRRTTLGLPGGVSQTYSYDAASQLSAITYKRGSTTIGNLAYTYNRNGQVATIDGTYARTDLPQPFADATYNANNQLIKLGATTLTYDAEGDLTNDGTTTYTWNARGQLATLARTGTSASFTYDSAGRRLSKIVNGSKTSYLYDGVNPVQELTGATPTPSANLLTGGVDEYFTRTDTTGARSLLTDALGSTVALADTAGTVQTNYTYDPFGKTTATGQANGNRYRFTGREDDGTGLYHYRARYYSPTQQRFISEDPIGFAGGDTNLYGYVGNDPANLTDPSGEIAPLVAICLRGALKNAAESGIEQWLSRRKVNWKEVAGEAVIGCVTGGLGRLIRTGRKAHNAAYIVRRTGRDSNKLRPHPAATGPHTVFRRDPSSGRVTHYETFEPQTNPRDPARWKSVRRYDGTGGPHFNKELKKPIPTPHVHDPQAPGGVRAPEPGEIP